MIETIDFILKIAFFVLTFMWASKILIFRSDKQIVINPILMIIASVLAIIPPSSSNELLFGFEVIKVRILLYSVHCIIILFGIYSMRKRNAIF
ncbi:hypothetical protein [Peptacetobacter sp.]|uniref:hypothetical protein n=1 Tax=Peptacetobacter sp. TaxID=2991975 RepID=UPI00262A0D52|nr:hypothetical protein [Peptacetobacter sp.]